MPPAVELSFLPIQCVKLVAHSYDLEECVRLFFAAGLHKPRQVQGKLLYKLIQQLLAGAPSIRIDHLQVAVLPGPLHYDAVGELDPQVGRDDGPISCRLRRAEPVAAKCPCNRVQHRSLTLIIPTANNGEPSF